MILLANFLLAIGHILDAVLSFVVLLVIIRAVISWVNPDPYNPIVRFLNSSTDPMLNWLKRRVRLTAGSVDFSPLVLLFLLMFWQYFLVQSVIDYGARLKLEAGVGLPQIMSTPDGQ